jgi:rifampin ADP-ribosylating transferase
MVGFDPHSSIVRLCLRGMEMQDRRDPEEAGKLFLQAWCEATYDFEKFLAAYFLMRSQNDASCRLQWSQTTLELALKINDATVHSALPGLYLEIANSFDALGEPDQAKRNKELAASSKTTILDKGPFFHGTRADLQVGELLTPGGVSNYQADLKMNHIYFTGNVNGAGLAAALAKGDRPERVYRVEPTGPFENDPNVTDKKFPGNPTRSYRSNASLKIVGEVTDWVRQTPEQIQEWRAKLANNKGLIIN